MSERLRYPIRRGLATAREAVASARAQPIGSLLTMVMVAGMCIAALLTTGRTVAAEQAALAQIDAAGTRSVIVQASPTAGLSASVLARLQGIVAIESAVGLGPIIDGRNSLVPNSTKVAVRNAYGTLADRDLIAFAPIIGSSEAAAGQRALASAAAMSTLRLYDGTGTLALDDGRQLTIVDRVDVPPHLAFLEPVVLVPSSLPNSPPGDNPDDVLTMLVVLARSPQDVAAVDALVSTLLGPVDPTLVTVSTSADLAAIRAAVRGELGRYGRSTVLMIFAFAAVLVGANLLAAVAMRRKDFGRRRALGATQSLIIGLLLTQVLVLATLGAVLGVVSAIAGLYLNGLPVPGGRFVAATATMAVMTALASAVPPASIASRRDPLHELRVP